MSKSTFFRFLILLVLLLIGHFATKAQSVTPPAVARTVTGFGDPEPMDPRYAPASEVAQLREQLQALTQAYSQLVEQYNEQYNQLQELQQTVRPEPSKTHRGRGFSGRPRAWQPTPIATPASARSL
ncbi:hypothetical protein [Hymenobacter sp. B81]|uniref:hypothetical protein n=1 Tax=Hymenobacter sp. B81 TaxID=3344878 RepID=UPI0037DC494B